MLASLVLTFVVLICLSIINGIINTAPMLPPNMRWGLQALMALIAVFFILNIWHLLPMLHKLFD